MIVNIAKDVRLIQTLNTDRILGTSKLPSNIEISQNLERSNRFNIGNNDDKKCIVCFGPIEFLVIFFVKLSLTKASTK